MVVVLLENGSKYDDITCVFAQYYYSAYNITYATGTGIPPSIRFGKHYYGTTTLTRSLVPLSCFMYFLFFFKFTTNSIMM